MMQEMAVQLVNLVKEFEEYKAVKNISMDIKQGEFLTLLGPSGCGKTTTLRMIAGFEQPTSGSILLSGQHVENIPPYERNVNTVFQSYALFPHMSIFDNIAFGLTMKKMPKDIIKQKVIDALSLVQLEGFSTRRPDQLSGGQKQRIAIARALVNSPKVLLLDEPMGALDLQLRKQMQIELKRLQKKLGITFVYVTHDQEEALTMSDRIAVMNEGVIEQIGNPDEIYEHPHSKFVASFIGETNLFRGVVVGMDRQYAIVDVGSGSVPAVNNNLAIGDEVYVAVRPERLQCSHSAEGKAFTIKGWYKEQIYVGSQMKTIINISAHNTEVVINQSVGSIQTERLDRDKDIYLTWNPEHAVVVRDQKDICNSQLTDQLAG
jgi:spermidine/putrescine transport system ATP-binding protein